MALQNEQNTVLHPFSSFPNTIAFVVAVINNGKDLKYWNESNFSSTIFTEKKKQASRHIA